MKNVEFLTEEINYRVGRIPDMIEEVEKLLPQGGQPIHFELNGVRFGVKFCKHEVGKDRVSISYAATGAQVTDTETVFDVLFYLLSERKCV